MQNCDMIHKNFCSTQQLLLTLYYRLHSIYTYGCVPLSNIMTGFKLDGVFAKENDVDANITDVSRAMTLDFRRCFIFDVDQYTREPNAASGLRH